MVSWWLVCTVPLCCALLARLRWERVLRYWAQRHVPHLRPHPLLGSMSFYMRQNPMVWFREYYERFRDHPYVGIWLLWQPALIINSPALARRVLVTDSGAFRDRNVATGKSDPIGYYAIFLLKEPLWSKIRQKISPMFTTAKLRSFQSCFSKKSFDLIKRIKNDNSKQQNIDLRSMYSDYSTDVISETLFGISSEATLGRSSAMRDLTNQFMEYDFFRAFSWTAVFFVPFVARLFRCKLFTTSSTVSLREIFRDTVSASRSSSAHKSTETTRRAALTNALIKIKEQNPDTPDEMLIAQMANLLQAGFDTTALTLTFCTYELAYHPHVQEKLYKELLSAKKNCADGELSYDALLELAYLNCVIKETLRKYAPMAWIDRVATSTIQLSKELTIPAGMPVYVNAIGIHCDPRYYPEPKRFLPERFLPRETAPHAFTFLPFGAGPRRCVGERLALQAARAAVAAVVLGAELRPRPGAPTPDQGDYDAAGIETIPGGVLSVDFVLRETN